MERMPNKIPKENLEKERQEKERLIKELEREKQEKEKLIQEKLEREKQEQMTNTEKEIKERMELEEKIRKEKENEEKERLKRESRKPRQPSYSPVAGNRSRLCRHRSDGTHHLAPRAPLCPSRPSRHPSPHRGACSSAAAARGRHPIFAHKAEHLEEMDSRSLPHPS